MTETTPTKYSYLITKTEVTSNYIATQIVRYDEHGKPVKKLSLQMHAQDIFTQAEYEEAMQQAKAEQKDKA